MHHLLRKQDVTHAIPVAYMTYQSSKDITVLLAHESIKTCGRHDVAFQHTALMCQCNKTNHRNLKEKMRTYDQRQAMYSDCRKDASAVVNVQFGWQTEPFGNVQRRSDNRQAETTHSDQALSRWPYYAK